MAVKRLVVTFFLRHVVLLQFVVKSQPTTSQRDCPSLKPNFGSRERERERATMASDDASSDSLFGGFKSFWADRLSFLSGYSKFVNRETPLPSWSDQDVHDFIASDPVYGPTVSFFFPPSIFCIRVLLDLFELLRSVLV